VVEICVELGDDNCAGDDDTLGLTVVDDEALDFATGRGFGRGRADMVFGKADSVGNLPCHCSAANQRALVVIHHGLLVSNIQKIKVKAGPKGQGKVTSRRFPN
jgi:hypothetical protein